MHSALGLDPGYGRAKNARSARKFVFGMGMTALAGVFILGVTSSLLELPEESEKWSKLLSASAMFCVGLSFLMWCVDELVFTPLALGEWTIKSLIPFKWTTEYKNMLRVAKFYKTAGRNGGATLDLEDFSGFIDCAIEQINNRGDEGTTRGDAINTQNQTSAKTCYGGVKPTDVSTIGKTFAELYLSKKKNKETEREHLIDRSSGASTSTAFKSTVPGKSKMQHIQRHFADIEEQSTSYQQNPAESVQRPETKNVASLPRILTIFTKPKTDLQLGTNPVEVHGMIRKKGVTPI